MITIGMNYSVRGGKEKIFEDAFAGVVDAMQDMDGHAETFLYRRVGAASCDYLVVSRWMAEEAFNDFVASDKFKKVTNWGKENILSTCPSHTLYRES